ncbi:MAG: fatty acid desaturase [Bauldia sp.]
MGAILRALPWRYALPNLLLIGAVAGLIAGGWWVWLAVLVSAVLGGPADEAVGDARHDLSPGTHTFFVANICLSLPLVPILTLIYLHYFTSADPVGMVALFRRFGIEFAQAWPAMGHHPFVGAIVLVTQAYAIGAVIAGHELIHWTDNRLAVVAGRVLMAFTLDASYSVSHVYGHHRNVGTWRDPSTARRGERVVPFLVRTNIGQVAEAFRFEARRLSRKGLSPWSIRNRALSAQLYSLALVFAAWAIAGWAGVAGFLIVAVLGRFVHQVLTYCQHYGVVRVEGQPIAPRHSWDSYRQLSSAMMYNMPLHAAHHASARRGWELRPIAGSPMMPHGYFTMFALALIPPLFRRKVYPILAACDRDLANDEERRLIRERGWEIAAG